MLFFSSLSHRLNFIQFEVINNDIGIWEKTALRRHIHGLILSLLGKCANHTWSSDWRRLQFNYERWMIAKKGSVRILMLSSSKTSIDHAFICSRVWRHMFSNGCAWRLAPYLRLAPIWTQRASIWPLTPANFDFPGGTDMCLPISDYRVPFFKCQLRLFMHWLGERHAAWSGDALLAISVASVSC